MSEVNRVQIPPTVTGPTAPAPTPTPATQTPPADPARPTWLPEKFKSVEDMAKAYGELEKRLGTTPEPAKQDPPKTDPPADPKPNVADLSQYETEFAQSGKLSDESYQKLEAQGYKRDVVDRYIQGQQVMLQQFTQKAFESVGGQGKYTEMVQWAASNLNDTDKKAFNETMSTGDMAKMELAVSGLFTKYSNAVGHEPQLLGGSRGTSGPAPFESTAQLTAAMRDPRYAKDPAYRKEVESRLAASSIF